MRNIFVLLICLGITATSFAQVDVRINPINAIFGSPDVSVEAAVAPQFGIEGTFGANFGGFNLESVDFRRRGFKGFVAGKYYFNENKGNDNLSVGLYVKGKHVDFTAKTDEQANENFNRNKLAIGLIVGQKWVSDNNIVFGIDAGVGRNIMNRFNYEEEDNATVDLAAFPFLNLDAILRVSVGYRFGGSKWF